MTTLQTEVIAIAAMQWWTQGKPWKNCVHPIVQLAAELGLSESIVQDLFIACTRAVEAHERRVIAKAEGSEANK
jgi:hypothetical protein